MLPTACMMGQRPMVNARNVYCSGANGAGTTPMCVMVRDWPKAIKANIYTNTSDSLLFYIYADVEYDKKTPVHLLNLNIGQRSLTMGDNKLTNTYKQRTPDRANLNDCVHDSLHMFTSLYPIWNHTNDPRHNTNKRYAEMIWDFHRMGSKPDLITSPSSSYGYICVTTNIAHRIHTLAVLVRPGYQWSRTKASDRNVSSIYLSPYRCYHASEILPIYCVNCQTGIAIPDTLIQNDQQDLLEQFKARHTEDLEHLRHLASVLADLDRADSLGVAYAQGTGNISAQHLKALETFKAQVIQRYQIATGHQLPADLCKLAFIPRLKTYDIDHEVLITSSTLVIK